MLATLGAFTFVLVLFCGVWAVQWFRSRRAVGQVEARLTGRVFRLQRISPLAHHDQRDQADPPPLYEQEPGPVYPNIHVTQNTVNADPEQETDQEEDNEDAASHNTWHTAASTPVSEVWHEGHSTQVTQNNVSPGPEQKTNQEDVDEGAASGNSRQIAAITLDGDISHEEDSTVDWPIENLAY